MCVKIIPRTLNNGTVTAILISEEEKEEGGSVSPYNAAIMIVERAQLLAFECNDVIGQLEERMKALKSSATNDEENIWRELRD